MITLIGISGTTTAPQRANPFVSLFRGHRSQEHWIVDQE
jgi:hypothetical protein